MKIEYKWLKFSCDIFYPLDLLKMDDEIDDTLDEQEEFQEKLVGVLETGKDFEYVSGFNTSSSTYCFFSLQKILDKSNVS